MKTKYCVEGRHDVDVADFYRWKRSPDGLRDECKGCTARLRKQAYAKDPERFLNYARKSRAKKEQWVEEIKTGTPCADCGERGPAKVMDFAPRPGQSLQFPLKGYHLLKSRDRVTAEILKCEVVCAYCRLLRKGRGLQPSS